MEKWPVSKIFLVKVETMKKVKFHKVKLLKSKTFNFYLKQKWVTKDKKGQTSFLDVPLYIQEWFPCTYKYVESSQIYILSLTVKSFHEIYKVTLTALPKGDYAIHFVHLVIFYSSQKFMQLLMENDWLSFRGMQYWIHSLHSAAPLTRIEVQHNTKGTKE